MANGNSNEVQETAAHEFGHHITMDNSRGVHDIDSLKPEGYSYVERDYEESSTLYEGVPVVQEKYGNSNKLERAAVASENAFSTAPRALNEQSYAGEATSDVIFNMEDKMPGFTASYLQRALRARQNNEGSNQLLDVASRSLATMGVVLGGLSNILARRRRRLETGTDSDIPRAS